MGVQPVSSSARFGILMKPVDVGVELRSIDPPHAAPSDLHGRELTGSNEGIDLRDAHIQVCGDIFQSKQARLDTGSQASFFGLFHYWRHGCRIPLDGPRGMVLRRFTGVWPGEDIEK